MQIYVYISAYIGVHIYIYIGLPKQNDMGSGQVNLIA